MSNSASYYESTSTAVSSGIAEYQCKENLNLYDSRDCQRLATQGAMGRHLRLHTSDVNPDALQTAIQIQLCEDDYPGWLAMADWDKIEPATAAYQPQSISAETIQQRLPEVIQFTQTAMNTPNVYLWGGTVGPNYDCSGLMQAAFASVGIWIPRDAYQQEAFTQPLPVFQLDRGGDPLKHPTGDDPNREKFQKIVLSYLNPGDLVFFGSQDKATHVGLYLGEGLYIHSSGSHQGRNGIGIDVLSEQGDQVSRTYCLQLRGAGRVMTTYQTQFN